MTLVWLASCSAGPAPTPASGEPGAGEGRAEAVEAAISGGAPAEEPWSAAGATSGARAPDPPPENAPGAQPAAAADGAGAEAAPEPPTVVLAEGDVPVGAGGDPVLRLGIPVMTGDSVAFTGALAVGEGEDSMIWRDGEVVWRNSWSTRHELLGASLLMGHDGASRWIYRALIDGREGILTDGGVLVRTRREAPGFPPGTTLLLTRRPVMLPSGRAYWVAEFKDGPGMSGKGRVLYTSPTAAAEDIEVVLRSDQEVDGFVLSRPWGLDFNYSAAPGGGHLAQVVRLAIDGGQHDAIYADGGILARRGDPAGENDVWTAFSQVAVDDAGNVLYGGSTEGVEDSDVVVAYNGAVVAREGADLGKIALEPEANVLALALDARGRAFQLWSTGGFGREYLMMGCDPADTAWYQVVMWSRRGLDLDGDGRDDESVESFDNAGHGPLLWPGDDELYVAATITGKLERPRAAILRVPLPACPPPAPAGPATGTAAAPGSVDEPGA